MQVGRNPNLGKEALAKLSTHWSWKVREAVALNPSTPEEILERLAIDPDQSVNKAARERMTWTNS